MKRTIKNFEAYCFYLSALKKAKNEEQRENLIKRLEECKNGSYSS